jgi:hypothetical protein
VQRVRLVVKKVAMDTTCETRHSAVANCKFTCISVDTNRAELELYALVADVENFGVPIAYLLLSTKNSVEEKKRMKALTSFLDTVHQKYGIVPDFVHTDNNPAEIGAVPPVWPNTKHQLCWWHMHDTLKKRLAQA